MVLRVVPLQKRMQKALRGVAVRGINIGDVRALQLPVTPFSEQKEIVKRVEALFKSADELEARYLKAKAHVDKLAQSILAKAFRGELVPQDPNDEPASVLLERITAQPNGSAVVKRRSRKMSLSVARNAMHRAIAELFYRQLTRQEKDRIWKYFKSRCAYCDKRINRKLRHGHMDHLDCSANSGGNYIRNRVLACKECNGNEKRELDWQEFLKSKCAHHDTLLERHTRITKWQSQFSMRPALVLSPEAEIAKQDLLASIQNFDRTFVRFRSLIRAASKQNAL